MANLSFRKVLSAPGLLKVARQCFDQIEDNVVSRGINLSDCLMSGLAIFGLKYPSLLQFDKNRNEELTKANLQTLYGIEQAPSDTYLRERLDEIDPKKLRKTFTQLFHQLQRQKRGQTRNNGGRDATIQR